MISKEGYLQVHSENIDQKSYAVLEGNTLIFYNDDPSKLSSPPISLIDIREAKLLDVETYNRPKSFAFRLQDDRFFEFSCATNSIKNQWVKTIMEKIKYDAESPVTNGPPPAFDNALFLSPKIQLTGTSNANRQEKVSITGERDIFKGFRKTEFEKIEIQGQSNTNKIDMLLEVSDPKKIEHFSRNATKQSEVLETKSNLMTKNDDERSKNNNLLIFKDKKKMSKNDSSESTSTVTHNRKNWQKPTKKSKSNSVTDVDDVIQINKPQTYASTNNNNNNSNNNKRNNLMHIREESLIRENKISNNQKNENDSTDIPVVYRKIKKYDVNVALKDETNNNIPFSDKSTKKHSDGYTFKSKQNKDFMRKEKIIGGVFAPPTSSRSVSRRTSDRDVSASSKSRSKSNASNSRGRAKTAKQFLDETSNNESNYSDVKRRSSLNSRRSASPFERKQMLEWSRNNAKNKKVDSDYRLKSPVYHRRSVSTSPLNIQLKYRSFVDSAIEKNVEKKYFSEFEWKENSNERIDTLNKKATNNPHHKIAVPSSDEKKYIYGRQMKLNGENLKNMELLRLSTHSQLKKSTSSNAKDANNAASTRDTKTQPFDGSKSKRNKNYSEFEQSEYYSPIPQNNASSHSVRLSLSSKQKKNESHNTTLENKSLHDSSPTKLLVETKNVSFNKSSHLKDPNTSLTDMAEWRRFYDWMETNGFEQYIETMRTNGITKLSMIELLQIDDMRLIGVDEREIPLFLSKVEEFSRRTKSFSDQVLQNVVTDKNVDSPNKRVLKSNYTEKTIESTKKKFTLDLLKSFDRGQTNLFFELWKQQNYDDQFLVFEKDTQQLQTLEFHLHLHFVLYPMVQKNLNKEHVAREKEKFKIFLEANLVSTEAFNKDKSNSFSRSVEFALYAGICMVPEPQKSEAFKDLFDPQWSANLRSRLEKFCNNAVDFDIKDNTFSSVSILKLTNEKSAINVETITTVSIDAKQTTAKNDHGEKQEETMSKKNVDNKQEVGVLKEKVNNNINNNKYIHRYIVSTQQQQQQLQKQLEEAKIQKQEIEKQKREKEESFKSEMQNELMLPKQVVIEVDDVAIVEQKLKPPTNGEYSYNNSNVADHDENVALHNSINNIINNGNKINSDNNSYNNNNNNNKNNNFKNNNTFSNIISNNNNDDDNVHKQEEEKHVYNGFHQNNKSVFDDDNRSTLSFISQLTESPCASLLGHPQFFSNNIAYPFLNAKKSDSANIHIGIDEGNELQKNSPKLVTSVLADEKQAHKTIVSMNKNVDHTAYAVYSNAMGRRQVQNVHNNTIQQQQQQHVSATNGINNNIKAFSMQQQVNIYNKMLKQNKATTTSSSTNHHASTDAQGFQQQKRVDEENTVKIKQNFNESSPEFFNERFETKENLTTFVSKSQKNNLQDDVALRENISMHNANSNPNVNSGLKNMTNNISNKQASTTASNNKSSLKTNSVGMQSQVNSYNKLLRNKLLSTPKNIEIEEENYKSMKI